MVNLHFTPPRKKPDPFLKGMFIGLAIGASRFFRQHARSADDARPAFAVNGRRPLPRSTSLREIEALV